MKKFQTDKHQKEEAERALRSLIARGYVRMHPTRGEMTYELTDDGLAFCREIARRMAWKCPCSLPGTVFQGCRHLATSFAHCEDRNVTPYILRQSHV